MKKKILLLTIILVLTLTVLPSCEVNADGSVKALTRPYIAQYECTEARYGEKNLLENYDFVRITLLDKSTLEVSYKPTGGKKKSAQCSYTVDPETKTLQAEIGILGFKFKESVQIKNGKFTIVKNLGPHALIVKFEEI